MTGTLTSDRMVLGLSPSRPPFLTTIGARLDHDTVIAKAQALRREALAPKLATSLLGAMDVWVATGAPPAALELRARGFAGNAAAGLPVAAELRELRKAFTRVWGYSIPCAEAVAALRGLSPMVEIGAGTAYWTALLRAAGLDVVATDLSAEGESAYGFPFGRYAAIEPLDGIEAVRAHRDRDVFCSWPTEGDSWCVEAVGAIRPGRVFALIADVEKGTAGTPELFERLAADFEPMATVELPKFPRIADRLVIHRRR